jgi:hypothetical protein
MESIVESIQLDRRISMMMDVQISSQIPLVQGKGK